MSFSLLSFFFVHLFFFSVFEEGVVISFEISSYEIVLIFDWITKSFLLMVGSVSSAVLFYSSKYMFSEPDKKKFIWLLLLFVLSMCVLSVSADLFGLMLGWDGLGISSLCLIIFYSSWSSMKGGMTTFLTNRLGDIFMIFSVSLSVMLGFSSESEVFPEIVSMLLLFSGMTKSAQIPFSAWLPLAMAAPTPVSSLVHSSTLVTAGVFLLIRFFQSLSESTLTLLFLVSGSTVLLAGSSALSEMDLKKVIALSTLSHISLMFLFLSVGWVESVMFHMILHAFFKSLLFMSVGDMIHGQAGMQDVRTLRLIFFQFPVRFSFTLSLFSMAGVPFLAGFFSKEFFLGVSSVWGEVFLLLMFYVSAILTISYSVRLFVLLWKGSPFHPPMVFKEESGKFLLVWSTFSTLGSVVSFSFYPLPSVSASSFFSSSVPFLFFLGVILGVISAKKLSVIPPFLSGGNGMWSILSFSTFFVSGVRKASMFMMSNVDYMGLMSKSISSFRSVFLVFFASKNINFLFYVCVISTVFLFSLAL